MRQASLFIKWDRASDPLLEEGQDHRDVPVPGVGLVRVDRRVLGEIAGIDGEASLGLLEEVPTDFTERANALIRGEKTWLVVSVGRAARPGDRWIIPPALD